jgi:hypothetical protein
MVNEHRLFTLKRNRVPIAFVEIMLGKNAGEAFLIEITEPLIPQLNASKLLYFAR